MAQRDLSPLPPLSIDYGLPAMLLDHRGTIPMIAGIPAVNLFILVPPPIATPLVILSL